MQVTARDVERIPPRNLHVPRSEFVAVWLEAELGCAGDWYVAGVSRTCRWVAAVPSVELNGRRFPLRSPVTRREGRAYEELIQAEYLAAETLRSRDPRPEWLRARGDWIDGVAATLRWAWGHRGGPPLRVSVSATG